MGTIEDLKPVEVDKMPDEIIVDIANRCVTVVSKGHSADFINMFARGNKSLLLTSQKFMISDTYRGTAKCHPGDKFYQEIGVRIATKRMQQKIYDAMLKRMTILSNEMSRTLEDTTRRLEKAGKRAYSGEYLEVSKSK